MGEKEKEVLIMTNNITITMADIMNFANVSGKKVTDTEIKKLDAYKAELKEAKDHNAKWDSINDGYKKLNMVDPGLELITNQTAGGPRIDEDAILEKYRNIIQEQLDTAAQIEYGKKLEMAAEKLAGFGLLQPATQQVISAPAPTTTPAPAPTQAPTESRMTMAERKQMIREMVGSGTGTSQFRRHCDTTAQANVARAKIEEWRSKGYITGAQKAELRAEVNAAAWLGDCGVTATR